VSDQFDSGLVIYCKFSHGYFMFSGIEGLYMLFIMDLEIKFLGEFCFGFCV
jgi:hypothetical protein